MPRSRARRVQLLPVVACALGLILLAGCGQTAAEKRWGEFETALRADLERRQVQDPLPDCAVEALRKSLSDAQLQQEDPAAVAAQVSAHLAAEAPQITAACVLTGTGTD